MSEKESKAEENKKESKLSKFLFALQEIAIWIFTFAGIALLIIAVRMPFKVRDFYKGKVEDYKNIGDLGTIGDFIGGTTVGFLTASSVVLLLATIIMQRKEIKISQRSIEELVKQTKSSVKQAEEAKKETQITNDTMKKQQFETTFFNMISLHQNNVNKLSYKDVKGNEVIKSSLRAFLTYYIENANNKFKEKYLKDNYDEIVDLIEYLKMVKFPEMISVQTSIKQEVLAAYKNLNFKEIIKYQNGHKMIRDFFEYAYSKADEGLISYAYYEFEFKHYDTLGSYFNSIVTIIKFLHESQYEKEDKENNTQLNQIYREIFFSQFSPHEMMLFYYYVKYSNLNEWLLEELKTYNLFYPRLLETLYLFWSVDNKNIKELLN